MYSERTVTQRIQAAITAAENTQNFAEISKLGFLLAQLGKFFADYPESEIIRSEALLNAQELLLLRYLRDNTGKLCTYKDLNRVLKQSQYSEGNNIVRGIVGRIREKIGDTHRPFSYIETVPKKGYRLIQDPFSEKT